MLVDVHRFSYSFIGFLPLEMVSRLLPMLKDAFEISEVRVLDVDALPLSELHRAFMYTLVRRRPAEAFEL